MQCSFFDLVMERLNQLASVELLIVSAQQGLVWASTGCLNPMAVPEVLHSCFRRASLYL